MVRNITSEKGGFTLIEVVMVIIISGIIFGIGANIITSALYSWDLLNLRKDLVFKSRVGMNRMVREIRQARPSEILEASATDLRFTDPNAGVIEFKLDGTFLKRNNDILSDNLKSSDGLQFVYWDANGAMTTDPNNIRRVEISLSFQKGSALFNYRSGTTIRNE